ncbi:MAG: MOSC domain-containing protein [Rhodocyclaceae bacterium]|jgi:MOSC domain-containing protein YiiM|nr:MOSC domain-containing protein [Rhodocyclaceae bacterium]MCL4757901.1 MOSC domain-containing protein [Rhodocyclaceae bacterium]
MRDTPTVLVERLFIGSIRPLPPDGEPTGMFKQPVTGVRMVGPEGLIGDEQADRKHHGGPQKALHHFPAEHYAAFALRWPERAARMAPGVLGENLSTHGLTEADVCIGDVFAIGGCRIQISQPRQPCWKINHRLEAPDAVAFITESGRTGWYYRVVETGPISAGDRLDLCERPSPWLTLEHYWRTVTAHRPEPALLARIAEAPGLAPDKARRHAERAEWLRANVR